jgi:thymidylate kinase
MTRSQDPRPTLLISFSGIDGAGKSTQIDNVCRTLEQQGLTWRLLTFWDDAACLKPLRESAGHHIFGGDQGVGSPDKPIERRDKNVRSPLMTLVRLGLYALDALSLRRVARRALRSGADVIIFDRYIFDELANLDLRNPVARLYVRTVARLVPFPQLAMILDANPAQAHARKPEYPLPFLIENRNAYIRLSDFLGAMTVIPPMPLELAKAEVARRVVREVFARKLRGAAAQAAIWPRGSAFAEGAEPDGEDAQLAAS